MNKISVVLASYQGERFIEQQLDSFRNQTRQIDEVILYDDVSKDKTQEIIQNYIERYDLPWNFYAQETNCGYIKNFAYAMKKSTGDIIFLCDQDDIWEPNKVECMMNVFEQNEKVLCLNTSFIYIDTCNQQLLQEDRGDNYGMLYNVISQHTYESISFEEIVYHNISMGCTMAFRSSIKDIYLNHSDFCAPHDWEINAIAAMQGGLYFLQEKLMRYRIHENNTVGNDNVNGRSHLKRVKNAITMYVYSKSLNRYLACMTTSQRKIHEAVYTMCEKRYELLEQHHKSAWFYLIRHKEAYHKIVSYKGMLADLLNR